MEHVDTLPEAQAREILTDLQGWARHRATFARQRANAEAEGRDWAVGSIDAALVSLRHAVETEGRMLADLARQGVDVARIAREVREQRA